MNVYSCLCQCTPKTRKDLLHVHKETKGENKCHSKKWSLELCLQYILLFIQSFTCTAWVGDTWGQLLTSQANRSAFSFNQQELLTFLPSPVPISTLWHTTGSIETTSTACLHPVTGSLALFQGQSVPSQAQSRTLLSPNCDH